MVIGYLDTVAQLADKKAQTQATRDGYLQTAVLRISSVQYANEFGEASEVELATSLAWKRYAVNLSRIEQQPDYPFLIE